MCLSQCSLLVRHGDPDNLESLKDQRKKGSKRKVTPQYIKLLMETIESVILLKKERVKRFITR